MQRSGRIASSEHSTIDEEENERDDIVVDSWEREDVGDVGQLDL